MRLPVLSARQGRILRRPGQLGPLWPRIRAVRAQGMVPVTLRRAPVAGHPDKGPLTGPEAADRQERMSAIRRSARLAAILLVVAGLVWASAVDADGDPTTVNLPAAVLADEVEVAGATQAVRRRRRFRLRRRAGRGPAPVAVGRCVPSRPAGTPRTVRGP